MSKINDDEAAALGKIADEARDRTTDPQQTRVITVRCDNCEETTAFTTDDMAVMLGSTLKRECPKCTFPYGTVMKVRADG